MARALPLVFVALLAIGLYFLPEPRPAHLAALQAHELLELPVGDEPAEGAPDERPPLWKVVLDSPAATVTPEGTTLRFQGLTQHATASKLPVLEDHAMARDSLLRGFRQAVVDGPYAPLTIEGGDFPVQENGANFDIFFGEQKLVDAAGNLVPSEIATVHLPEANHKVEYHHDAPDAASIYVGRTWNPPSKTALLPPLIAVALAILFRRPLVALFLGVLSGAVLVRYAMATGLAGSLTGGTVDVFTHYLRNEITDLERLEIIGFVVFMLAMVGVMTRSGGIRGLMDGVARRANDGRKTQVATWLMGLIIFFDDYANTILVGSTMRPLTDRFRISREKLSYLVDSTAAPVAGLSVFSTWIAFEVSTFNQQLPAAGLSPDDGYAVFLQTIPYSFYCFLTLFFVGLITLTGRDFGPMLKAERRARRTGELIAAGSTPMVGEQATTMESAEGVVPRAWRALAPLFTFLLVTLLEIARNGGAFQAGLSDLMTVEGATGVLYEGSGSWPLLAGSLAGFLVAALAAFQAGLVNDVFESAWTTLRSMGVAFAILFLAWMIGAVCKDLGTATYLAALLGDAIDARMLPVFLFLLAGAVAFATGSSWSTMSILLPLVVGLAYGLGTGIELADTPVASGQLLVVISIAAVLSGSIFGDHCSPISDTTVMSSIASASDHIDHVRTQAPYAIIVMGVSIVTGYLPATYYGLSPWTGLGLGAVLCVLIVFVFGRKSDVEPAA